MLKLYYFHGATCGLKARLTLAEKDVEYTHEVVDRSYLRTPDYKKLNPNAVVPTLIHGPNVLIESCGNLLGDVFENLLDQGLFIAEVINEHAVTGTCQGAESTKPCVTKAVLQKGIGQMLNDNVALGRCLRHAGSLSARD